MSDIPSHPGRRRLLGCALTAASGVAAGRLLPVGAAAQAAPASVPFTVLDQRPWRDQTRRLKITRSGLPVASLIFPTDYPTHFRLKPELHQVCTPAGVPVTGSHEYCFIHHQSIMCGHGKVQVDGDDRIVDFYRHLPFPDQGRADPHRPPDTKNNLLQLGPSGLQRIIKADWHASEQVVIRLELVWQTREMGRAHGDPLLQEERFYRLFATASATVVDVFSQLRPAGRPATLIPENDHGYIGVRVHDFIDVDDGGTMRDSEGRENPAGHFRETVGERRIPRWIDCTGRLAGATAGIALMSHPANAKNEWYAREFGLMIVSGAQTAPVRITEDTPFEFAARCVAHDGPLPPETADRLHREFAAVTAAQLRGLLEG